MCARMASLNIFKEVSMAGKYKVGTVCKIVKVGAGKEKFMGRECTIISNNTGLSDPNFEYEISIRGEKQTKGAAHTSLKPIEPPKSDEQEKFQAFLDKILEKTDEMILEEI